MQGVDVHHGSSDILGHMTWKSLSPLPSDSLSIRQRETQASVSDSQRTCCRSISICGQHVEMLCQVPLSF